MHTLYDDAWCLLTSAQRHNGRRTDRTIKSSARILLLLLASTPTVATPSMHNIIMDIVLTRVCIHYLDCLYYSSMHTLVLPLY